MSSPKSAKISLAKLCLLKPRPIRVLILGDTGVGKSALVVRFLTRRYIGDYDPDLERVYPHTASIDNESVYFEILDPAAHIHEKDNSKLEGNIRWANIYILMYSVTDKCSFDDCNRLKFLINYNKRKRRLSTPGYKEHPWDVPVLLVGNKNDQVNDRMVSPQEGYKRSKDIGCQAFHEISVRESIDEVFKVFTDIVRHWRKTYRTPKLRRTSSDLYTVVNSSFDQSSSLTDDNNKSESFSKGIADTISSMSLVDKNYPEESVQDKDKNNKIPYRARASTDGSLDHKRLQKLQMNLCLRPTFLRQRRMSIAMQGESTAF